MKNPDKGIERKQVQELDFSEQCKVIRRASVFSGATILSRILGLVRDILIAGYFGTGLVLSAFVVAFAIPNMMRRLLGEGALSSAFVPIFSDSIEHEGHQKAVDMANTVATITGAILILLVVVISGILWIVDSAFGASPTHFPKIYYVVRLGQVMIPYLFFICLAGFGMGVLNTFHHYVVPALSPALMNLLLILAIIFVCPLFGSTDSQRIYGLAITVLAGGFIQLGILHFPLRTKDVRYRVRFNWHNPYLKRFLKLFFPAFFAMSVTQVNVVIDHLLAFIINEAAPAELYFANRLVQLPLGVFGIALSVALLPTLSRLHAAGKMEEFKRTFSYVMRQVMAIGIPAAAGILVLRKEIVALVFQRGFFTDANTHIVSQVLMCYTFGLFSYFAVKITIPAFLALHDSKTPMRLGLLSTGVNLVLNLILMFPLKSRGFALATAISSSFYLFMLLRKLKVRIGGLEAEEFRRSGFRIIAAAVLMGAVVVLVAMGMKKIVDFSEFGGKLLTVLSAIAAGFFSYYLAAMVFKVREITEFVEAFRRK